VTASYTTAEYLLPQALIELRRTSPGIAVTLSVSNSSIVIDDVLTGRCDLGFIELPPVQPGAAVSRMAATPPAAAPPVAAAVPRLADANLAEGRRLFTQNCAACHGEDGRGGHTGGAPLDRVSDLGGVMQTVAAGRNTMPPFKASFTADQIRDVSAYVVGELAGRRP
jgi:mono/diheme cytochrome c family protein